jgi:Holliday junction resolvase
MADSGFRLVPYESSVKARLRRKLHELGPKVVWFAQAAGIGNPGVDYIVCAGGRLVAIEVKRAPGYKLTPRQVSTMEKIRVAGGLTYVVNDTKSIEECVEGIKKLINQEV